MSKDASYSLTATCVKTGTVVQFRSMAEAADEGFSQSCISRCVRGVAEVHAGYRWETSNPLRPAHRSKYREQIQGLYAQGYSSRDIARLVGCAHSTVNYNIGLKTP